MIALFRVLAALPFALVIAACEPTTPAAPPPTPTTPAAPAPPREARADLHGKPEAPVAISVSLEGNIAHVQVTFAQAGSDVRVRARTVRGVPTKADGILSEALTVPPAAELVYDVPVVPGIAGSLLAVDVSGEFAAGRRATVRTFPLGPDAARKTPTKVVAGKRLHVLPAIQD